MSMEIQSLEQKGHVNCHSGAAMHADIDMHSAVLRVFCQQCGPSCCHVLVLL